MPFFSLAQHQYQQKQPGVFVNAITGRTAQLCMIRLLPGQTSDHSHAEEQLGYILSGRVIIKAGDEEKEIGPGDGYLVPMHVHHEFCVVSDEVLEFLEIFCPPKSANALW